MGDKVQPNNEVVQMVILSCEKNYAFTMKRFEIIKKTPKDWHYIFAPLTFEETVKSWTEGINQYNKTI